MEAVQYGTPATCLCVIEYAATMEANMTLPTLTPSAIIHTCDAHAAITDAAELHTTTAAEVLPLARARVELARYGGRLVTWTVKEDATVYLLVDDTALTAPEIVILRDALTAVGLGITVEYLDTFSAIPLSRETGAAYVPEFSGTVRGFRITQGSRYNGIDTQFRTGAVDSYYPVLGNGDLILADPLHFPANIEKRRAVYTLPDVTLWLSDFAIRTSGNGRTAAYACAIEEAEAQMNTVGGIVSDVTKLIDPGDGTRVGQFVVIPPEWDGIMTCRAAESEIEVVIERGEGGVAIGRAVFVAGRLKAPEQSGPSGERLGVLATHLTMQTRGRTPRMFFQTQATAGALFNPHAGFDYVPYMIGGSPRHWVSRIFATGDTADFVGLDEDSAKWPARAAALRVRAPGVFSWLNLSNDGDSVPWPVVGLQQWDLDMESEQTVPTNDSESAYWARLGAIANTRAGLATLSDETPGNEDYSWRAAGAGSQYANIWRLQAIWQAQSSNGGLDWMIGENWSDSYWGANRIWGDALLPDWIYAVGETNYRYWYVSLLGSYGSVLYSTPVVTPADSPALDTNPYVRREFEVTFPTSMTLSNLRGYMQDNIDGDGGDFNRAIEVAVCLDGVIQDWTCRMGIENFTENPEGYFENAADTVVIPANTPVCLVMIGPPNHNHSRARIPHVDFTLTPTPDTRECLTRVLPDAVPVDPLPCATALARCVKITRTDGEVFAYTDHDRDITTADSPPVTFKTCGGFAGSATELGAVIGEVGNMEIVGAAKDLGITLSDLFGGMFDGAQVDVYLIPWKAGDTQPTRLITSGTIGLTEQQGRKFTLEALSPSAYLAQKPIIEVITPDCRFVPVGSPRCAVDIAALAVTVTVTAVATDSNSDATVRRRFTDAARTEADGYFDEGVVTCLTGANAGQISKAKVFAAGEFVLWEPLVYEIAIGDTFSVTPGCDGKWETCRDKFNNRNRWGGFRDVPGLDATSETPAIKDNVSAS